jgi:sugar/nucleoside kinase (ribokinase family)
LKPFDITIAGEINLDLILYGLPAEMAPERELLASDFRVTLGSSSAIVAHNCASLGARVAFTTLAGPDDFGRIALERLHASGVDISRTIHHGNLSTGVTLLLPHGSERHILTYPGTMAEMTIAHLDFEFLIQARHFHLSSLYLQKGLHAGLPDLLRRLKRAGLTISLDTNDDPDDQWGPPLWDILPYVDLFLPSESELCRMTGCTDLDAAIAAFAGQVPTLVVKRGDKGARVQSQGKVTDVSPVSVVPVDTIGAGDSFDAGFLRAYLLGRDAVTCARAGNITGALSTQAAGGTEAFRDPEQRDTFLRTHGFFDLLSSAQ